LRTGIGALVWRVWLVVGQGFSWCAFTLSLVWAVGNDMTSLLTAKTLHRPSSLTTRKSVYGVAVSNRPVFWHVGAQILARSGHHGDALCPQPRHGRKHPCFTLSLNMLMRKSIFLVSDHSPER